MRKMGTNIDSYLKNFQDECFGRRFEPSKKKKNNEVKLRQAIETWLTFGLIEEVGENFIESKTNLLLERYIVEKYDAKMMKKFFLNKVENLKQYNLVSIEEDKESLEMELFSYKGENELINAICLSTIYFFYKKELAINYELSIGEDVDEKTFRYYKLDLLNDNEIISKCLEVFFPLEKTNYSIETNKGIKFNETSDIQELKFEKDESPEKAPISSRVYKYNQLLALFLGGEIYKIPVYQRDYVWKKHNIRNLFLSILNNEAGTNLGTIVLHKKTINHGPDIFTIVDGQQRLTSLFIILRALHKVLEDKCEIMITIIKTAPPGSIDKFPEFQSVANAIKNKYFIDDGDGVKLSHCFIRIEGDENYESFFALLNGNSSSLKVGNITTNLNVILSELDELNLEELTMFAHKLLNEVYININIDTLTNELVLFEVLNTTSIKLSTIDLMKSYFVSLLEEEELEKKEVDIQKMFHENIIDRLDSKDNSVDEFIRIYLRFKGKSIKIGENETLFSIFKNHKNFPPQSAKYEIVKKEILELKEVLDLYLYVKKTSNSLLYNHLQVDDFFDTLDRDIYYPFVMYILKNLKEENIELNMGRKCLFEVERFEIIFQICNYRGQSLSIQMDKVLEEVKKIPFNELNPTKIADCMKTIDIFRTSLNTSSKVFEERIIEHEFSEKLAKKVLSRVINQIYNNNTIELNYGDKLIRVGIPSAEHILPKKSDKWKIPTEAHIKCVDKIGNFTILDKKINSKIGNNSFESKKKELCKYTHIRDDYTMYKQSEKIKYSFDVMTLSIWNKESIDKRTKFIATICKEIWT